MQDRTQKELELSVIRSYAPITLNSAIKDACQTLERSIENRKIFILKLLNIVFLFKKEAEQAFQEKNFHKASIFYQSLSKTIDFICALRIIYQEEIQEYQKLLTFQQTKLNTPSTESKRPLNDANSLSIEDSKTASIIENKPAATTISEINTFNYRPKVHRHLGWLRSRKHFSTCEIPLFEQNANQKPVVSPENKTFSVITSKTQITKESANAHSKKETPTDNNPRFMRYMATKL